MCFYNSQSKKALEIARRYGRKSDVIEIYKEIMEEKKRNGQQTSELALEKYFEPAYYKPNWPIITVDEQIQVMRWGMIPANTGNTYLQRINKANLFVNARSDKIFDTYPYQFSITHQRCLIPSTGYFEPHYDDSKKNRLYYIYLKSTEVFSIGGIWAEWYNPETKEKVKSFSIITTDANSLTCHIHNGGNNPHRMPFIIAPENEEKWVNPNLDNAGIKELMKIFPATDMDAYPLRKDYKTFKFTDEKLIEREVIT